MSSKFLLFQRNIEITNELEMDYAAYVSPSFIRKSIDDMFTTPRIDIDHRGKTVIGTMSEGITPYKFTVLLKHFADKAVELGYWLELDVT